jgi:2-polyprenyl-3-methyl-5-hydroxy-6-metoxy-1,4-benzoquinol methylase
MSREAETFDDGRAVAENHRWVARVPHVMSSPNSTYGDRRFLSLLGGRVANRRAMDVGCGTGELSAELHAMGASAVYGFDISSRQIDEAHAKYSDLDGVTFRVHAAGVPIVGRFDVIVGQSVLHHIDFRTFLATLFEDNLMPGGRMVFMEPMSHPFTLAFHRLVPSAHTPDEWPLTPTDIRWLRQHFAAQVMPINLFSFPAAILSSFVLPTDDNWLTRLADRVDRSLEQRRRLLARGRQGIIVIDRPAG